MKRPLVSVVTIFLNEERFLAEAVESVLAQSYPHWELLLCDDGSSDASSEIARGYARKHPDRIRYLDHEGHANRGMSATRNLGIGHARGELVAFLDGDDVWLPQKLERQVAILEAHADLAMVYGPSLLWHGWTGHAADAARDAHRHLGVRPDRVVSGPRLLGRILRGMGESPGTCSVLIRREAVADVGGFENTFRGLHEDQAFFSKVFLRHDVYVMGESFDRYRQHPDSCCHVAARAAEFHTDLPNPAHRHFLQWLLGYLEARPANPGNRRVIRWELWLYRHPRFAKVRSMWRQVLGRSYVRSVQAGVAVSRRVLPASTRRALWNRWFGRHARVGPASAPASDPHSSVRDPHERPAKS